MKQNTYTAKNSGQKKRPADTQPGVESVLERNTIVQQEHSPLRRHLKYRNHQLHLCQTHHSPHRLAAHLQILQKTHDPKRHHYLLTRSFHPHPTGGLIRICPGFATGDITKRASIQKSLKKSTFLYLSPYFSTNKICYSKQIITLSPGVPVNC